MEDDSEWSINRNILECKDAHLASQQIVYPVLIETYWNVKGVEWAERVFKNLVLIETYWNVKKKEGEFV